MHFMDVIRDIEICTNDQIKNSERKILDITTDIYNNVCLLLESFKVGRSHIFELMKIHLI